VGTAGSFDHVVTLPKNNLAVGQRLRLRAVDRAGSWSRNASQLLHPPEVAQCFRLVGALLIDAFDPPRSIDSVVAARAETTWVMSNSEGDEADQRPTRGHGDSCLNWFGWRDCGVAGG
jgi:hypothetical protein